MRNFIRRIDWVAVLATFASGGMVCFDRDFSLFKSDKQNGVTGE